MVDEVAASNQPALGNMAERLREAIDALAKSSKWMGEKLANDPNQALASATPYLRLFGLTAGGVYLAKDALATVRHSETNGGMGANEQNVVGDARFFADHIVTSASGLAQTVMTGADSILAVTPDRLSA